MRVYHGSFLSWRLSAKHRGEGLITRPCKTLQQLSPHLGTTLGFTNSIFSPLLTLLRPGHGDLTYSLLQKSCPADASHIFPFALFFLHSAASQRLSLQTLYLPIYWLTEHSRKAPIPPLLPSRLLYCRISIPMGKKGAQQPPSCLPCRLAFLE